MEDITWKVEEVTGIQQKRRYFLIDNFRELIENYMEVLCSDFDFDYATHCLIHGVKLNNTKLSQEQVRGLFDVYHTEIVDNLQTPVKGFFFIAKPNQEDLEERLSGEELGRILNPLVNDRFNLLFVPCSAGRKPFLFLREIVLDRKGYGKDTVTEYPPKPRIKKPKLVTV